MEFVETMSRVGRIRKIAICISGGFRTWKEAVKTWDKIIRVRDVEVDYFFHTWDTVYPPKSFVDEKRNEGMGDEQIYSEFSSPLDPKELQEVIDYFKPVSYLVETPREFKEKNRNQTIFASDNMGQFYGIMMAGKLKRKHELQNDFMYDLVIRMRFDTIFYSDIIVDNYKPELKAMYGNHYDFFYENNWKGRIGDIFWCSDSLTYDILSDFYLELPTLTTYPRGTPPEYTWFNYIKKNQIKIIPNSKWNLHLLR